MQRGIDLFEAHDGIEAILTTDRAFDEIDELERVDPADERAVATLVG